MLIRRTIRAPVTGVFQIAARTNLPSHGTSFGPPTLSDTSRPTSALRPVRPRCSVDVTPTISDHFADDRPGGTERERNSVRACGRRYRPTPARGAVLRQ